MTDEATSNVHDLTMRIEAGKYAALGWWIFPLHSITSEGKCTCGYECGSPGKHPRTPRGFKDASVEAAVLDEWWTKWPDANIGLSLGHSQLVAVDVDPRNDGDTSLADLEKYNGALPKTRMSLTGGGGLHYVYKLPDGLDRVASSVPAPGVEIKSWGGYIVLPPSRHALSKRGYVWDVGQGEEITAAPFWLCQRLSKKEQYPTRSPSDGAMGVAFITAGLAGQRLGPDRMSVKCPWEHEHTTGEEFDTSTVVFGPSGAGGLGWFHCSHSHCVARFAGMRAGERLATVFAMLPAESVAVARASMPPPAKKAERLTSLHTWERSLRWNNQGTATTKDPGNLALLLTNLSEWKGIFRYDEARDRIYWAREPPKLEGLTPPPVGPIGDFDYIYVSQWFNLHNKYRSAFPKEVVRDNVLAVAQANRHNSLTDHLDSLEWDGKNRLERWLSLYLGVEESKYTRFVGRAWLVSAMARAYSPGVKADYVLTLEGKQGVGKTTTFNILGGEWYTGHMPQLDNKDARLQLATSWITEFQELASFRGVELQKVKAFISDREDKYRPPYAANLVTRPRRCVFCASTNEGEYIADSTGARRFWPVYVHTSRLDELSKDRDALLAEAREAYKAGVLWWPQSDGDYVSALQDEQDARLSVDPWEADVERYIRHKLQLDPRHTFTINELLSSLGIAPDRRTRLHAIQVGSILRKMGAEKTKARINGTPEWVWRVVPRAGEA